MKPAKNIDPQVVAKLDPAPLQGVPAALLNSADIAAYSTLLNPPLFEPFDEAKLKPATYEIPFEGEIYLWRGENSDLEKRSLRSDETFTIQPNSIVFICPSTYFRVPNFLALRFNLHIRLVHRGLLLGTGPLVDPGFAGRLTIPVHNLTSQSVIIKGSEGFIWVEVTKISPTRSGTTLVDFPIAKKARTPRDYFRAANNLKPIVSTLQITSEKLREESKRWQKFSVIAGVGLAITLAGFLGTVWSLINDTHHYVTDARKASTDDLEKKASTDDLEKLRKRQDELKAELESLKQALKQDPHKAPPGRAKPD